VAASGCQKGCSALYRLKEGERWTLLDRDRAMVIHPTQAPKIVYPDGRVEANRLKDGCLAGGLAPSSVLFFASTRLGT
jgi:hypothetical protein